MSESETTCSYCGSEVENGVFGGAYVYCNDECKSKSWDYADTDPPN